MHVDGTVALALTSACAASLLWSLFLSAKARCNRWAAGRFDAGVFKEDWRFSTKVESQYLAQLYATIGIRPPTRPSSCSARPSR
jgi:hypothetical protein